MSFKIECAPGLTSGRSHMKSGIEFQRSWPTSPIATGTQVDQNTPTVNHSDGLLNLSTSISAKIDILTVTKYMRPGYLWDFWLGEHSEYGKVVLKLLARWDYPCMDPEYWEYVDPDEVLDEAVREEQFYNGPLLDLQGETIPRFYGTYLSKDGQFHCAILLEFAGYAIGPGMVILDEEWRNKLYEAYWKIHSRGVGHDEVSSRHVLIDEQYRIRLVGFRRSAMINLEDEDEVWQMMCEAVMVRRQIGLEKKSEVCLTTLPEDYYGQIKNREAFIDSIQPIDPKDFQYPEWAKQHNQRVRDRLISIRPNDPVSEEDFSDSTGDEAEPIGSE
ncbi:uncharacterized protein I206_101612 [Kwoniella pini CBS 10737]|uniref:Protein kinase domain-containing protein n=1 Tax=Kwoniella pini CBS 10737 TaxID=1296096 RepID=A0A1B9HW60_9TREE|nr:uncharacterized protein I206_06418 [Kwoniella pini CBS 10737]OCF47517.1 hypothetical protein I206_06418 [Kwoniella pini CBS 10737]